MFLNINITNCETAKLEVQNHFPVPLNLYVLQKEADRTKRCNITCKPRLFVLFVYVSLRSGVKAILNPCPSV
jgi:hypothetical protein